MSNNPVYQPINPNSGALPAGVIVETEQQPSGAQRQVVAIKNSNDGVPFQTEIIDADGHIANVQAVTATISGDEYGVVTNALIHGKSTAGGGAGTRGAAAPTLTSKIPLGVTAAGVGDIMTICFVKDSATNASVGVSLVFEEVR